jgi:hypothetical protein
LLNIAKSLQMCPDDATDLRRVIRTNLASWAPAALSLQQVRSLGTTALAAGPNGEVALLSDNRGALYLVETDSGKAVGLPLQTPIGIGLEGKYGHASRKDYGNSRDFRT